MTKCGLQNELKENIYNNLSKNIDESNKLSSESEVCLKQDVWKLIFLLRCVHYRFQNLFIMSFEGNLDKNLFIYLQLKY